MLLIKFSSLHLLHGRWLKTFKITFWRILLVRPRSHAKKTRAVYSYVASSFIYSNPVRPHTYVFPWLQLVSKISTFCAEVIIICMCYGVWHTPHNPPPPPTRRIGGIWTLYEYHIYRYISPLLSYISLRPCEENDIVMKNFKWMTNMTQCQGLRAYLISIIFQALIQRQKNVTINLLMQRFQSLVSRLIWHNDMYIMPNFIAPHCYVSVSLIHHCVISNGLLCGLSYFLQHYKRAWLYLRF